MHMEMFRQEFANGLVCCAIYWRGLYLDLVASVRKLRYAFALAPGMHLDVYFHRQLGKYVSRGCRAGLQFFLHTLVIFHGRKQVFLTLDEGAATDEIVCT